jgi:hypothetical protein
MKIQENNQLGLLYDKFPNLGDKFKQQHLDYLRETLKPNSEEEFEMGLTALMRFPVVETIERLTNHTDYKNHLITDTAKEIASKIKVGDNFNFKLLDTIKEQRSTYLLGKTKFVRFDIKGSNIFILLVQSNKPLTEGNVQMYYRMFRIDTAEGSINIQRDASDAEKQVMLDTAKELIQLLIFINLSDVEVHDLPPNRKTGTRKSGSFKNETDVKITVVDSSWNKIIIRTEAFNVSGHLRLQACGPNFSERKLVWINPYKKEGYIRKPKKSA